MQPSGQSFSICSITQPLMVGFFAAFAVASLTGSDALGWVAAAVAGGAFALYQRARGGASCAVPGAASEGPAARPAVTPEQLRAAGDRAAAEATAPTGRGR